MKKKFSMFTIALAASLGLVACGSNEGEQTTNGEAKIKIGMMTDAGTIDDKSFNQSTWEGIQRYETENGTIESQYIRPSGESTQDYLEAADNLLTAGNQMIVAPGFKFEEAIAKLQTDNPDIKFVMIDGQPKGEVADNTIAIHFAEQQGGFLAGVVAALETKTNKVGFVGGMAIPSVQKFGYGFVTGVAYANANLGTNVEIADYLYNGTFTDIAGGQTQAGGMYDKGIDIIFTAAGAVGNGVIAEAKTRAEAGEDVKVIGVDVDQYDNGVISDGSSVILTSAIKRVDNAAYDKVEEFINGTFKGGEVITMDAKNNGIGLPEENPNLSESTKQEADKVLELIKDGTIVVPADEASTNEMLQELGFDATHINLSGQ